MCNIVDHAEGTTAREAVLRCFEDWLMKEALVPKGTFCPKLAARACRVRVPWSRWFNVVGSLLVHKRNIEVLNLPPQLPLPEPAPWPLREHRWTSCTAEIFTVLPQGMERGQEGGPK